MRVIWQESVQCDIETAFLEGLARFGEKVAKRFFVHIWDYDSRLAAFPYMGKVECFLSGSSKEYRSLVVHNHYKLIYLLHESDAKHPELHGYIVSHKANLAWITDGQPVPVAF